jgi:hypothetical protein
MNTEQKNKFIELRVKGESLGNISQRLGIPKTTLWRWDKEEKEHINELQLAEQEDYEAEWSAQREERIAGLQNTIGDLHSHLIERLEKHGPYMNSKDLILHINLLRAELDHYRIKPLKCSTAPRSHREPAPLGPWTSVGNEVVPQSPRTAEQNGTISPQNGTPHHSTTPSSHREPAPLGPWTSVGNEVDSSPLDLDRSTTPSSHQGDQVDSQPSANIEQNGTISPQTGTVQ